MVGVYLFETSRGIESWSVIDKECFVGKWYYLLESNKYGDEVPYIVINEEGKVCEWNCYDTLIDWWGNY